ncbi:MAG: rod shape-determining protein MreC [Candidatus Shapirobacteria bacterium]|nr:rod shape-determining protein MreC [Candidatus Shapirobacteria bacterium]
MINFLASLFKVTILKSFNQKKFLGYFLIAGIIFLLDFWIIFRPLKSVFSWFFKPLRGATYQFSQVKLEEVFYSGKLEQTREENRQLEKQIMLMTGKMAECQWFHDENQRLKNLLDFYPRENFSFISAQVIGRQDDFLIINQGKKNGVFVNQLVVEGQYLVGRVLDVYDREARVLKLGSASLELPVLIFSNQENCFSDLVKCQKGKGIITGDVIKEILREEEIGSGDLVTLLDGPPGILLGRIGRIQESQDKIFKQAQLERLIDLNNLTEVFLINQ